MPPGSPSLHGFLPLDKPPGWTSHDCVARIRRETGIRRVGHAGTLDPMATGLLLLCLGRATRLSELVMSGRKAYRAGMAFGAVTDTQDSTGAVIRSFDASGVTRDDLEGVLVRFRGVIAQIPPMVSAVHHEGRRLYELARRGIEVERAPRTVVIHRLELIEFAAGKPAFEDGVACPPAATLEVECSSGAYIRTLVHDIGGSLGTGAHMTALRRLAVGPFPVEDALTLEEAVEAARTGCLRDRLAPMTAALEGCPTVTVTAEQLPLVGNGRDLPAPDGLGERETVGLVGPGGDLIALARSAAGRIHPRKVLFG